MRKTITAFLLLLLITQTCFAAILSKPQEKKEEAEVVNDYAKVLIDAQASELRKDLRFLFNHQKEGQVQFRVFLFTTDAQHGGIPAAKQKLTTDSKLDPLVAPVVFIYDAKEKKYAVVIDERVETFISKQYLSHLLESKINNGLTYDELSEILIRFTTVTELAIQNGLVRQDKIPAKEEVENKNGEIEVSTFESPKEKKEEKTNPTEETEPEGLPAPIILLAVILTAAGMRRWFVQWLAKRKKARE